MDTDSSLYYSLRERIARMGSPRALALLALVAMLALAGCQAPGTPQNANFAPDVTVVNATGAEQGTTIPVANNGSVDPGAVFAEVQGLLGSDVPPPSNVRVLDDVDDLSVNVSMPQESPVRRYLNVTRRGDLDLGDQENGAVGVLGSITIYPGQDRDPESATWVLAHELAHYVQVRSEADDHLRDRIAMDTTDGRFTQRAMMEGPAVYTTEAYLDEYMPSANSTLELYNRIDEGLPAGSAGVYSNRQYLLGYHYVESQVDSPAELDGLYNDSALTSEHLIHGDDPAAEPMATLDVAFDGGSDWTVTGRDRMGEAFVWTALEDRLGTERAREAAAGWGNDSLLTIYPVGESEREVSFAWVLRWDDAANATEFAADSRAYVERAGTESGDLTRLDSGAFAAVATPGERTTVLLLGDRSFVDEVTVSATDGTVTVSAAG